MEISETVINAYTVSLVLIVLAAIVRIFFIPKFANIPSRFQMILELSVDGVQSYTASKVGRWASLTLSPYMFTIALLIAGNGVLELLGFRAAMTDLNFTLALSLITFVLIQVYAIKKKE